MDAGQTAGTRIAGDVAAQTERVLLNLIAVLREAKMGPENVVKATVYLSDMADFPKMNAIYDRHFSGSPKPARSTVQVAKLPAGAKIEIEVIALR